MNPNKRQRTRTAILILIASILLPITEAVCIAGDTEIPVGGTVYFTQATHSASTGAATAADSIPTFFITQDGSTTFLLGATSMGTLGTGTYGMDYSGSFNSASCTIGRWYNVVMVASVGSVVGHETVMRFRAVGTETISGYQPVDLARIGGSTSSIVGPASTITFAAGTLANSTIEFGTANFSTTAFSALSQIGNATTTMNLGTFTSGTFGVTNGLVTGSLSVTNGMQTGSIIFNNGTFGNLWVGGTLNVNSTATFLSIRTTQGITAGSFQPGNMAASTITVTNGITAASFSPGISTFGNTTFSTLALTNASNLASLTIGTATSTGNVTGSVGSVLTSVGSVIASVTPSGGNVGSVTAGINGAANITSGVFNPSTFLGATNTAAQIALIAAPSDIAQAFWTSDYTIAENLDFNTVNGIGSLLLYRMDTRISTRGTSNYAGGDTSGVTTLLSRIPGTMTISTGTFSIGGNALTTGSGASAADIWAYGTRTINGANTVTTLSIGTLNVGAGSLAFGSFTAANMAIGTTTFGHLNLTLDQGGGGGGGGLTTAQNQALLDILRLVQSR